MPRKKAKKQADHLETFNENEKLVLTMAYFCMKTDPVIDTHKLGNLLYLSHRGIKRTLTSIKAKMDAADVAVKGVDDVDEEEDHAAASYVVSFEIPEKHKGKPYNPPPWRKHKFPALGGEGQDGEGEGSKAAAATKRVKFAEDDDNQEEPPPSPRDGEA